MGLLKENEFLLDGYFYEIHNSDRMMEKKKIIIEIKVSIKNFKLIIFNDIPYFEINLDSIDSSFEIRKKITVHQDNDKILSIISTLKIRIDRKIFNTTEDFNKYLVDNLGLITDDKITQTLRKKYGIKITGNIKERNKIDKINGIKN